MPGDKSISHRAVLLGAIADGETVIEGFGRSADTESTVAAVRALGVEVGEGGDAVRVSGVGLRGLREPEGPVDCGNAGTLVRLVAGILAGQGGKRFELDRGRVAVAAADGPDRRPVDADGRDGGDDRRRPAAAHRRACPGPAALRAPRCERSGEVVRPARGTVRRGRPDHGRRARPDAGPHRADAARGGCVGARLAGSGRGAAGRAARPAPAHDPGRFLLDGPVPRRRDAASRLASPHQRASASTRHVPA